MNFKKQFDKNINSLNAEINASFLVFGGTFVYILLQASVGRPTTRQQTDRQQRTKY